MTVPKYGTISGKFYDEDGAQIPIQRTAFNLTTTPNFIAIAAQGAGKRITVLSALLSASKSTIVTFEGSTGNQLSSDIDVATSNVHVLPFHPLGWWSVTANEALTVKQTNTTAALGVDLEWVNL